MTPPRSFSGVVNVVLSGMTPVTSVFVQTVLTSNQKIKLYGFWSGHGFSDTHINGLRRIGGTFEDLLREPDCDFIFLCHAPQVQFKILRTFFLQRSVIDSNKSPKSPIVILIPPISPCYDLGLLLDCGIPIKIAMPLRKLAPVSLLANHLKNLHERKPLDSIRNASGLPSHWSLGSPQSFHARLSTTSSVKPGTYSWLCEPGVMGGGLINLYGAGLIDLAFILTGGLRLRSVSCISRVFDWKLTDDPNCIRRMSAEDYVMITGELESNDCGAYFGAGAPVAVFCLSSELPPVDTEDKAEFVEDFRLYIELIGSSGRFVIPEQGNQITWTPVKSFCSRSCATEKWKNPTEFSENQELSNNEKGKPINGLQNSGSNPASAKSLVNGISHSKPFDGDYDSSVIQSAPLIDISTVTHNTETATFSFKTPHLDSGSKNNGSPYHSHPLRFAWSQWLNQLVDCVQPNGTKLNVDSLLATPEHWGYVQRVLIALEKSARLRCWVDVLTGERI